MARRRANAFCRLPSLFSLFLSLAPPRARAFYSPFILYPPRLFTYLREASARAPALFFPFIRAFRPRHACSLASSSPFSFLPPSLPLPPSLFSSSSFNLADSPSRKVARARECAGVDCSRLRARGFDDRDLYVRLCREYVLRI